MQHAAAVLVLLPDLQLTHQPPRAARHHLHLVAKRSAHLPQSQITGKDISNKSLIKGHSDKPGH